MTANFIHRVTSNYGAEWNNNSKMVRIRPKAVSNLPESCYPEMVLAKKDIIILVTIDLNLTDFKIHIIRLSFSDLTKLGREDNEKFS